jgi:cytochrome P450
MRPVRGPRAALWHARFLRDPVASMDAACRRHGPLCVLGNMLPLPRRRETLHVMAFGPEFNRQVLGNPSDFHNSTPNPAGSALGRIRSGLTAMNGPKHRQQRHLVQPPFTKKAVDAYGAKMVAIIDPLIARRPAGGIVEVGGLMRRLALRLSAGLLFGREAPGRVDALGELIQEYLQRSASAGVHAFPYNWPGTPYRGLRRHAERIERELLALFQDRRNLPGGDPDLLDILVRAHDQGHGPMSDTDLIGQALILIAASYENVSSALTWTLFLVAQHPGVAADLCDELGSLTPTAGRLTNLPLLDAVVKESLRVLPPVPFTVRVASRDVDLGGVALRPGDRVACSIYVTHHQADLFPDPERFNPHRWFGIDPGPYEYLPFGAGPRFCIGSSLAMAEIKVALGMILQRWRLAVVPGTRIDRQVRITMSPRHGLPMSVHPQDRRFHAVEVRGNIHSMVKKAGSQSGPYRRTYSQRSEVSQG